MRYLKPFLSGFLQVFLVTATTFFVANGLLPAATVTSFFISLVWTFNVRHALGDWPTRLVYCTGAATGTAIGFLSAQLIASFS